MMSSVGILLAAVCCLFGSPTLAFRLSSVKPLPRTIMNAAAASSTSTSDANAAPPSHLYLPSERDARYQGNYARYLLDLHDAGSTFDFCGGALRLSRDGACGIGMLVLAHYFALHRALRKG